MHFLMGECSEGRVRACTEDAGEKRGGGGWGTEMRTSCVEVRGMRIAPCTHGSTGSGQHR